MRIRVWWQWINSKPFYLRWFIFLLLLRPLAEQYYNLKEISPLLSPLYWIGVLTLILSILGIIKGRKNKSGLDKLYLAWGALVIISILMMSFGAPSLMSFLNYSIKLVLPVVVFFFLRVFIKEKYDLVGLLTTFLISCIFPVLFLLAGVSRGGYFESGRLAGAYADVFNNAFYLSMGFLVLLFHFILNKTYVKTLPVSSFYVALGLLVILLGLWVIKHMATIIVVLTILSLFIYIVFRRHRGAAIFLILVALLIVFTSGDRFYNEVLDTRIEKEVEVIEGTRGLYQGFHGRMSRWMWLTGEFNKSPLYAQAFGYPYTMGYSNHMVGITPHNDFLRILFFTGYAGLLIYLLIFLRAFRNIRRRDISDKFFLLSIFISTILYSMTTVPTFYPGYVNLLAIAFAYSSLPLKSRNLATS